MKLVESEFEHRTDEDDVERPSPPRPERRRVYVSLMVTMSVLIATVVLVYSLFPKRDNELLDAVIDAHLEPKSAELSNPGDAELDAWTVGMFGRAVPWPEPGSDIDAEVLEARSLEVLRRKIAVVRYRIGDDEVSLAATVARSAPPRTHRRTRDGVYGVSWRHGRWTFVAAGPERTADRWTVQLEAPR